MQQVDAREVARRVVEVHVLRARVARVDAARVRRGVPAVDRGVELHARVGALPRRLRDLAHEVAGLHRLDRLAGRDRLEVPVAVVDDGLHELVGDAHRVVRVLVLDRVAVLAVEVHVEAGVAQRARLALLDRLAPDEVLDVGVVDVEDDHLGGAARLAARLDRAGRRVGAAHEAHRARRGAAALQVLLRRADPRQVDARARTALEDGPLFPVPVEDRVHRVVDREDEARRRLLRHALHADVEPHRRVERGALVHEHVLELVAERLGLVARRRSSRRLMPQSAIVSATRSITWRSDHSRSGVPSVPRKYFWATMLVAFSDHARRELDVGLEEGVAAVLVVRDPRVAPLPLDGVVRVDARAREVPADPDPELLRRHRHVVLSPSERRGSVARFRPSIR